MPIQRILKSNAVKATHIAANAVGSSEIDLAASYAFTGAVTGAGTGMDLVSSSSTTSAGLSALEIDLPTTTDFVALKLILRGLKSTTATNNHWRVRFRQQGGSIISSADYNYMFNHNYSNDSAHGSSYHSNLNVDNINFGGYAGDGTDDSEMTSMEFDILNSAISGRYTRGYASKSIEKRHTDAYHYYEDGSFTVASNSVLDRIEIIVTGSSAFTSYGYALYKVLF
jgi:hypothetical protein